MFGITKILLRVGLLVGICLFAQGVSAAVLNDGAIVAPPKNGLIEIYINNVRYADDTVPAKVYFATWKSTQQGNNVKWIVGVPVSNTRDWKVTIDTAEFDIQAATKFDIHVYAESENGVKTIVIPISVTASPRKSPGQVPHRSASAPGGKSKTTGKKTEYFPADSFLRGFLASPTQIAVKIPLSKFRHLLPMKADTQEPFWSVAQWFCTESLAENNRTTVSKHESRWQTKYDSLRIASDAAGHAELHLGIDSLAIYRHNPISYENMGIIRPHFLLYRNFYPDTDNAQDMSKEATSTFPALSTFKTLDFRVKVRLANAADLSEEYKGAPAASRRPLFNWEGFFIWFKVVDRHSQGSSSSENFAKSFWVGCKVYDSTLPYPDPFWYRNDLLLSDGQSFVYQLCFQSVFGERYRSALGALLAGKETEISLDVLRIAREALLAIQEKKSVFLDAKPDLSDFTIAHFNIGWELASPFRGNMAIRDLSLQGEPR